MERKHRRRATGALDLAAESDPSNLLEYLDESVPTGTGWPQVPSAGPGVRDETRRRFAVWGVGLLVLLATIWAVWTISGSDGPPDLLAWILVSTAVVWFTAPAVYLVVQPAIAVARGTLMRPCRHCGLSIGGKDEWCRFCHAWQDDGPH